MAIPLGTTVRDRITGMQGIVYCVTDYLYQCRRIGVQPTNLKDGIPADLQYFDEPQLEVVEATDPAFDNPYEVDPDLMDTRFGPRTGGSRDMSGLQREDVR